MNYVDIYKLENGESHWKVRVYEDGRVKGRISTISVVAILNEVLLIDPMTNRRHMTEGPGLLRSVEAHFNSGMVFSTVRHRCKS
jgi:hypothetical protein